jgi:hypothetical protein
MTKNEWIALLILVPWMTLSRGFHFMDGSVMIFMIAAIFIRTQYVFWALAFLAMAIDIVVIGTQYGYDSLIKYCVGSAAYYYLFFAFGAMWWMGKVYASHFAGKYIPFIILALIGTFMYETIAAGSYYMFSGDFENPNWADWWANEPKYMLARLQMSLYYSISLIAVYIGYRKYVL